MTIAYKIAGSSGGGDDGGSENDYSFSGGYTEDDSWIVAYSLTPTDDALTVYEFKARGFSVGGVGNTFYLRRAVKSVNGTVTGFTQQTIASDGDGNAEARIFVSGTGDVQFQVKGDAAVPYDWSGEINFDVTLSSGIQNLPEIIVVDLDQVDPAGGDVVTITGSHFGGLTSVTLGGVAGTILGNSVGSIWFECPAVASGSHDLVVNTGVGASNAVSLTVWVPTDDPDCTLLFDSKHTAYIPGVPWQRRYSILNGVVSDYLESTSFSTDNPPSVDGAPVFDGNGSDEGGFKMPDAAWTANYLGPSTDGHRQATIAAVFDFTNNDLIGATDASGDNIYDDPAVIYQPSMFSIATGLRSTDNQPIIRAWIYNATDVYAGAQVVATQGDIHAVVTRWGLGAGTLDLSVDGALSGSSYYQRPLAQGVDTSYSAHVMRVGVTYPYDSPEEQTFAGSIRAICILKAKCSDEFITKFNKWKLARFGT